MNNFSINNFNVNYVIENQNLKKSIKHSWTDNQILVNF